MIVVPETDAGKDLLATRDKLRELKDKFLERYTTRKNNAQVFQGFRRPANELSMKMRHLVEGPKHPAEQMLGQLAAAALLDIHNTFPLTVNTLHKKMLLGTDSGSYKDIIGEEGHDLLERILVRLAAFDKSVEHEFFDVNGKDWGVVKRIDRARLCRLAGIADPLANPIPPPCPPPLDEGPRPMGPKPPGPLPGPLPMPEPAFPMGPPGPFPPGPMGPGRPLGPGPLPMMPPVMGGPMPPMPPPGDPFGPPTPANLNFPGPPGAMMEPPAKVPRLGMEPPLDDLLQHKSVRDRYKTEKGEQLLDLLQKPSAKESEKRAQFQSVGGQAIREHCPFLTKEDCRRANRSMTACPRVHFRRIIHPWTDVSLGNCSYLDTCRNIGNCKYIHYELDDSPDALTPDHMAAMQKRAPRVPPYLAALPEPQWINCDVRTFDMEILGKFGVIMADPPWEIHQDLPYGTMGDDEMRSMNIGCLQDDGVIFLWVTGRAMELGRECLEIWGYKRVDELIWIKTNQLQRLIRTGRTGHWLNHSKEHCLVGIKGSPVLNKYVDCDVVVAEVRETSRKPDEMYSLLERLSPGTRKLEIFARPHNVQPGWVCLGNQLAKTSIKDPQLKARYEAKFGPLKD